MTLLSVDGLAKLFGGLVAVDDVSFGVESGEILGLIGPNGSARRPCQRHHEYLRGDQRNGALRRQVLRTTRTTRSTY